ncbi:MAG: HI0074 family nucleotidyltransferase substrate-binding subunit [Candidatus Saccharimonadales bacterium]
MDKITAQQQQLKRAADFLRRALGQPEDKFQRAAVIQAFEFSYELSWKYLKSLVEINSGMVASPRAAFREAAKLDIVNNPGQWFDFQEARNLTTHTYVEAVAVKVYAVVKTEFVAALDKLIATEI